MSDEPQADDLVELGGRQFRLPSWLASRLPGWRPSRGAGVLAVAALVVGLAAGYAAGDSRARGSAALPAPAATASAPAATFSFADSSALTQDIATCSVQTGRELQLGVRVTNQSTATITLLTARAVLPRGGLKQVTWQWATCGAIPDGLGQSDEILAPGASTWLTATFKVQLRCPGPAPVQFTVGYLVQGKPLTASLPGFPDLSQVPYTGCQPTMAGTFSAQSITEIS
jgi:hypothetical protein